MRPLAFYPWVRERMRLPPDGLEDWPARTRRRVAALVFAASGVAGSALVLGGPYATWAALAEQNRQMEQALLARPLPAAADELPPLHSPPTSGAGPTAAAQEIARRLPTSDGATALLRAVDALARQQGVGVDMLRPAEAIQREHYRVLPVRLRVSGDFHEITGFADAVAHLQRLAELTDVALTPAGGTRLTLEATLLAAYTEVPGEDESARASGQPAEGRE